MWTDKTINLLDNIPNYFSDIYEFQQLFSALNDELELFRDTLATYKDDLFLTTASESVISRYQNLLKTSGSTAEQKRANIIAKFSEKVPFDLASLKTMLESYVETIDSITLDNGKISVLYNGDTYLTDKTALIYDAYNIMPANLEFTIDFKYLTYLNFLLKNYEYLSQKTWLELKLGY